MTAFASDTLRVASGTLRWDIKSLNQRYLEISFKLPDAFQALEYAFREAIKQNIKRGKLYCHLEYEFEAETQPQFEWDPLRLNALIESAESVAARLKNPAPISALELLKWPNVIKNPLPNLAEIQEASLEGFSKTLDKLKEDRAREGLELKKVIEQRLQAMKEILDKIRQGLENRLHHYRNQWIERIAELKVSVDPNRLEQEILFQIQKMDSTEEIDRLTIHIQNMRALLSSGGVIGRHLDFLSQELNREANTLASKSNDAWLTQESVELKVLIEQIREQVQNIE